MLTSECKGKSFELSADDTKTENYLVKHGPLWTFAPIDSTMHFLDEH
jgi:hypothetical protein